MKQSIQKPTFVGRVHQLRKWKPTPKELEQTHLKGLYVRCVEPQSSKERVEFIGLE